ncbi:MAG: CoA pyrophosphatase [Polyangiaceae bacterium]
MSISSLRIPEVERALERVDHAPEPQDPRAAAVAAILREGPSGLEILFIRRAERTGDPWSGHMAFPGGRRDPGDPDLLSTAIRETVEEIGVDLASLGRLLGVLDDQDASGRGKRDPMPLRPFVFELTGDPRFVLNSQEVSEVLWTPLAELLSEQAKTTITIQYHGQDYTLPAWDVGGRTVWGLTYWMMSSLVERLERVTRR